MIKKKKDIGRGGGIFGQFITYWSLCQAMINLTTDYSIFFKFVKSIISLQDTNDNTPVFESVRYTHTVSEVTRVGSMVLTVSAEDQDLDANGLIHYSLAPISYDNTDTDFFFVNAQTGDILLHK